MTSVQQIIALAAVLLGLIISFISFIKVKKITDEMEVLSIKFQQLENLVSSANKKENKK
ncbi:hypothetical protein ACWN8V_09175 [Vagococcus elongatus]|uniref:hypothetical protein n=1 Tax=Vagococcus elongatus TaxID=180344 RepID=UPI0014771EF7|nr:hypothetical protein [Vagococcus elongatus]